MEGGREGGREGGQKQSQQPKCVLSTSLNTPHSHCHKRIADSFMCITWAVANSLVAVVVSRIDHSPGLTLAHSFTHTLHVYHYMDPHKMT